MSAEAQSVHSPTGIRLHSRRATERSMHEPKMLRSGRATSRIEPEGRAASPNSSSVWLWCWLGGHDGRKSSWGPGWKCKSTHTTHNGRQARRREEFSQMLCFQGRHFLLLEGEVSEGLLAFSRRRRPFPPQTRWARSVSVVILPIRSRSNRVYV